LRGAAIHPLARILAACQGLDVFVSTQGSAGASRSSPNGWGAGTTRISRTRCSTPADTGFFTIWPPGPREPHMDLEPSGQIRTSDDADVDRIAAAFADIVDAKSPYTGSHSKRVADVAEALAARLGLRPRRSWTYAGPGCSHDLGKLGVPNVILDKPARLDSHEMDVIRRHPELTLRILQPVPTFSAVAELAACHHERLDGTGYFRGLTAPELALGARIVAVADVFEALTAERPYRAAMPVDGRVVR